MSTQRDKQRERQQRGEAFQDEMRRSWAYIKNCWRLRLKDGKGGTQVADEVVLLQQVNILGEHKRTEGDRFELSFLRSDQITGLLNFDRVIDRSYGLVFISFHNLAIGRDVAYAVRLVTALRYMQHKGQHYIHLDDFIHKKLPCAQLLRRQDTEDPTYDLQELIECCKLL
ncbi:hypothetical protein [Paenibacillus agilis]|uniref:Uncharacterized protein n=1 Tax=Paenibacillus agilis TaxID=3020863 RepID=A0A559IX95_9BACL|nr:hypothetical protein [Paenibacillus agilis]TVX92258.1 hypothetical protein FPZ44_03785 [Paenibacillus agilis]